MVDGEPSAFLQKLDGEIYVIDALFMEVELPFKPSCVRWLHGW